jgi:hypothetical protein
LINKQFEQFQRFFFPVFIFSTTILFLVGIALWFWLYKHKAFYSLGDDDLTESRTSDQIHIDSMTRTRENTNLTTKQKQRLSTHPTATVWLVYNSVHFFITESIDGVRYRIEFFCVNPVSCPFFYSDSWSSCICSYFFSLILSSSPFHLSFLFFSFDDMPAQFFSLAFVYDSKCRVLSFLILDDEYRSIIR